MLGLFNLYKIKYQYYTPQFAMATMNAVGVAEYGPVDNFESRNVPRPGKPTGRDVLVKSVTPGETLNMCI